jgi:hypothetical protein
LQAPGITFRMVETLVAWVLLTSVKELLVIRAVEVMLQ